MFCKISKLLVYSKRNQLNVFDFKHIKTFSKSWFSLKSVLPDIFPFVFIDTFPFGTLSHQSFSSLVLDNNKNNTKVVLNGGIWHATRSGIFKFLTTLTLLKTTKITISQKTPFFKITKK